MGKHHCCKGFHSGTYVDVVSVLQCNHVVPGFQQASRTLGLHCTKASMLSMGHTLLECQVDMAAVIYIHHHDA